MPRKEREARPTRGEQLPDPRSFSANLPDEGAPFGAFAIDAVLSEMDKRGWVDRSRPAVVFGGLKALRAELLDAAIDAFAYASSVYANKADRSFRERKIRAARALQDALGQFLAENREDARLIENVRSTHPELVEGLDFSALRDAETLFKSLDSYVDGIETRNSSSVGDTGDHLKAGFVRTMRNAFSSITGSTELQRGQKEALISLAVATWCDAKLPGHDAARSLLESRIRKWFLEK
ncbi:hypothetical protein AKG11_03790 [Shinella sp. SUS2]|uniref:hypothetical protein n=1 Tax=unclassified Shinella TaxID=2643062 RepID=UPI000681041A|nr:MULTISPECIES: hypothetical protein [unclassified Shinella]KNY18263.1 hypothetical protein AKG11_03790 [Shinella sp. SUS2]KOC77458.1 hypothetical protein AKG10_01260 [Shinella sp. GWS1]